MVKKSRLSLDVDTYSNSVLWNATLKKDERRYGTKQYNVIKRHLVQNCKL
jgi:hypothetical protein